MYQLKKEHEVRYHVDASSTEKHQGFKQRAQKHCLFPQPGPSTGGRMAEKSENSFPICAHTELSLVLAYKILTSEIHGRAGLFSKLESRINAPQTRNQKRIDARPTNKIL